MLLLIDVDEYNLAYAVMNIWLQYIQIIYS